MHITQTSMVNNLNIARFQQRTPSNNIHMVRSQNSVNNQFIHNDANDTYKKYISQLVNLKLIFLFPISSLRVYNQK